MSIVENHYEFVPKPAFPVVGKIYSDSIDWGKDAVDPYSFSSRHNRTTKMVQHTDKARVRDENSTYNTQL
jgi:hypothetical protein